MVASPKDLVCVAVVATAHGVRGALKLRCFTEQPQNVAIYGPVFDKAGRELFRLRVIGAAKEGVIATASGIVDRDQAERLRGVELYVPRERLPATGEDEFYLEDLIVLDAVHRAGKACGRVASVANYGAGDVLEIDRPGASSLLLPFTRSAVPEVDLAARRIVIDPPVELVWDGEAA